MWRGLGKGRIYKFRATGYEDIIPPQVTPFTTPHGQPRDLRCTLVAEFLQGVLFEKPQRVGENLNRRERLSIGSLQSRVFVQILEVNEKNQGE